MDILQAVFLGLVQGITEWLPISSSGHLALLQNYLEIDASVSFDLFLHLGTITAVFIVYWGTIKKMLSSFIRLDRKTEEGREAIYIVLAMVPTAIIGFGAKAFFESMYEDNLLIGISLLFTGLILFAASKIKDAKKSLTTKSSLIIGLAQGIAIAPGISRSGMTISAGLLQDIEAKKAARFSFLLSIPAILGASFFELKDSGLEIASESFVPYLAGAFVAAAAGYMSIKFLLRVLEEKRFGIFAYYCWILGAIAILTSLM